MMKKLLATFILFSISQISYANPADAACPKVADLGIGSWDRIEKGSGDEGYFWGFKLHQNLNTNVKWDVMVGPVFANDPQDAKEKLNTQILSLEFKYADDENNHITCGYISSDYDFIGIAVSPAFEDNSVVNAYRFKMRKTN